MFRRLLIVDVDVDVDGLYCASVDFEPYRAGDDPTIGVLAFRSLAR
jgi:hypothetical protein